MKLESVTIKRFRSIKNCELRNCGRFNVIIGKNNSGKSNILSAIDAFFNCLQSDSVIALEPPIGKAIDFFDNGTEQPIEITLSFSLQESEKEALYHDIVTEASQMRYAVDGIHPSSKLHLTVSIINVSHPRAYVSKIVLRSDAVHEGQDEQIILSVGREAALELSAQVVHLRQVTKDLELLQRMFRRVDTEDWPRLVRDIGATERERVPLRTIIRRFYPPSVEISSGVFKKLKSLMIEPTYDDFNRTIQTVINDLMEEAASIPAKLLKNKIYTFAGEESSVPQYVLNLLHSFSQVKVLYLKEQRKQIGKEEAQRLLSLKVQRGGFRTLRSIQDTITALLGVQVDAFQGALPSTNPQTGRAESSAELDVDNFLVEVNGSGIREALRLILDYEFVQPHILLVEEPEIHLHPALETSMMHYLKNISVNCQVFLTTHSTNFIDTAEMENIFLVSKSDSTQVQLLNIEEAEALIPQELGIRLSSLFMFDRLVFVEGITDSEILHEWATTLKVNLSQANVGFITTDGSRNYTHYARSDVLSFLTKRRVKIWFLLDRDERTDSDVARLEKSLGEKASLKVLKKREIENYLLSPRAIVEFIKLKRKLSSSSDSANISVPTEDAIRRLLDEKADELKQITIDKCVVRLSCRSIHPSLEPLFSSKQEMSITQKVIDENQKMIQELEETNEKVEEIYLAESARIDEMWQTSKLDLVPGDHLLDMVCRKYDVRYKKKEQDGSRLASLMHENEIDKEIKDFIQAIGKGYHSQHYDH